MKFSKIILIGIMIFTGMLGTTTYAQNGNASYTIALLISFGTEDFMAQMAEYGYVEGKNITYVYMPDLPESTDPVDFDAQRLKAIKTLVKEYEPDVFVVTTDSEAVDLRASIGNNIPIVFARSDDPVLTGAVESLLNPGGNATGMVTNKRHERRLQLITEIDPTVEKVLFVYGNFFLNGSLTLQQAQVTADELGIELVPVEEINPGDTSELINNLPEGSRWLFLTPSSYFDPVANEELVMTCIERHIGITTFTDAPTQGYILGYGPNQSESARQAAQIVDRILRGASPADLPVQTAENFLTINLEAAAAIGMEIPKSILRQAHTIVRPGDFDELQTSGN